MKACVEDRGAWTSGEFVWAGGHGSGQAREAEAGAGNLCFFFFSLPIQDYDLGLETCSRKMVSRDPLGAFGKEVSQGRGP